MDALLIYRGRRFVGKHILRATELVLGRGGDIVLDAPGVSRRHAALRPRDGKYVVLDLASANGTSLNGSPILQPNAEVALRTGDEIGVGEFAIRYLSAASEDRLAAEIAAAGADAARASEPEAATASGTLLPPLAALDETRKMRVLARELGTARPDSDEDAPAGAGTVKESPEVVERIARAVAEAARGGLDAPAVVPAALTPEAVERARRAHARILIAAEGFRSRVQIDGPIVRVGRAPEAELAIGHESISHEHATIVAGPTGFAVIDRRSAHGTAVAGTPLPPGGSMPIPSHTAALRFGAVECLFLCDPDALPGTLASRAVTDSAMAAHLADTGAVGREDGADALREAREKGLDLGEVLVLRGLLAPERWVALRGAAADHIEAERRRRSARRLLLLACAIAVGVFVAFFFLVRSRG